VETDALSILNRLDLLIADPKVEVPRREHGEAFVGDLPVRAAVEVLQRDVHMPTVDPEVHYRVKR